MQLTLALPVAFAALGLAAPTIEKRGVGRVTLYKNANFQGQKVTLTIDTGAQGACTELPADFINEVESVQLASSQGTGFHCRLTEKPACVRSNDDDDTFFFDSDIADLNAEGKGNKADSIWCAHT
ncbi:hypothetical protein M011DRAFT_454767 [Sporormia fimetaria CBS 119925]|uniref:Beta/gamma crystallin 'Greek key' domain-containing protein n=1 Tax=Sporormia fimetaria CBS 119925 TaxID=1340428 RepID=A0A6A6VMW7_9PLEO|nr:hypothetical protein M011DRAFT_454767 [Sporormia fimetaria CBS 119925]